jgi:hypothetical protein
LARGTIARGTPCRPGERELAEEERPAERVRRENAEGRQRAERDREIERASPLLHVGRREVDRDAVLAEVDTERRERALHADAALADGRLCQADELEGGDAATGFHLHADGVGEEADENGALSDGEHGGRTLRRACLRSTPCFFGESEGSGVARPDLAWPGPGPVARLFFPERRCAEVLSCA